MPLITNFLQAEKSLKQHLTLWVLIPLFVVLSVSAYISYYRALYFANLAYDRSLFRAALALADQVDYIDGQVMINLPQVAKDLIDYDADDVIYYRISDPDGRLVLGEETLKIPKHLPKASKHFYYDDVLNKEPIRVVAFSLPIDSNIKKANILVQVAETRVKRERMVTEIVEEMLLPQLLIMILATALIFVGIKRGLRSLQPIQQAINQRSHLDLAELDAHKAPIEIQPLIGAMNNLMRRVREGVKSQQEFIADASHQLRTPIAGLHTQAELALREKNPAHIHDALSLILTSSSRLSHLLNRLLSMASVDHAADKKTPLSPVNLVKIVTEITSEFIATARQKHIDLGVDIAQEQAIILGDELMLREMLSNIIDNAVIYTPAHGMVTVSLTQDQNSVLLSVIDNGIGIPMEERQRVFERFHRLHDNEGEGCGLGLAIVQEIVHAHNASIRLEDGLIQPEAGGFGTKVIIQFARHTLAA